MQEYLDLGHMVEVTSLPAENKLYYIPHHGVVKPDSLTTKVRVVFDASAKTTTGWSLNDCMFTGARQQRDLTEIIMNWRIFQHGFKADITKMYRMIQLTSEHRKFHTIVWRNTPAETLKEYQLTTTTFGTAAAPFLATRTLVQIAHKYLETHPLAAAALLDHFYVDDLICGSHSITHAIQCKEELVTVLDNHKFSLCKWASNCSQFLDTINPERTEKSLQMFSDDDISKALGLSWNPQSDQFLFKVNWLDADQTIWTKRQFLAESSKLFDPLGWLAPITINAKIMMQDVWLSKIGWDEDLPQHIANKWIQFRQEFRELEKIRINRWIDFTPDQKITFHGFSDASEKAYSAVIYARIAKNDQIRTHIITAKTRVAPVRTKTTLPRLELCGAVLVSNLMKVVLKAMKLEDNQVYMWTDSMITLGWINQEPNRWKTFIANRVSEIQVNKQFKWNYVPTDHNPADCASRGLMPLELLTHPLWWNGPQWLQDEPSKWPLAIIPEHALEQKSILVGLTLVPTNDTVNKFSSWHKLIRIAAYARRFKNKQTGQLSVSELNSAEEGIIRRCQEESFQKEIKGLVCDKTVHHTSKLKSLNAFVDKRGILRVGGRIQNASISYAMKHPIILPAGHHISKCIIQQMHKDTHHGGPQLMKNLLARKYWIIQGKQMIHNAYSQCLTCRKFKGDTYQQQMGELPKSRVQLTHPFASSGVDYAGPIEVKSSNLRSARIQKGYVAVYVCMATKAVHLELVCDQTTQAFLASFNRFTARRGLPGEMYSDNGSNFEGADNELRRWFKKQNEEIYKVIVNQKVEWHFIPPGAPNFGGLWERAVRSMKEHLRKTLKTARLTFEEYSTLLCQIEACMNSRPLCAASDEIDNLDVLSPGHFLIGQPLISPPQPITSTKLVNNRCRWTYVQTIHQQLWERWHREYLVSLQQRHKWQETSENAKPGDLVALKDEDLAPRNWLVGKIVEIHKGQDGKVRVASIRVPCRQKGKKSDNKEKPLKTTILQRPIRKLCPLMTTDQEPIQMNTPPTQLRAPKAPASKTYNLRPRPMNHLMMVALICLGLVIGSMARTSDECMTLTTFEHDVGIFFENMGRAGIQKSEWNIHIYFELETFYADLARINKTINQLDTLCKVSEKSISEASSYQCSHTITLLTNQLDDITVMNELLKLNKQPHRHPRAAPLNIVGWLGHELFGIMDADNAEKMEQRIMASEDNFEYVQQLLSQQTSIIDLTNNLLKDSLDTSEKRFTMLTSAIQQLSNETDLFRKRDQIIGWALYTSLILGKLEKTQRNMVNMLTDLQQGHVSSYLFTPRQFKTELDTINDHIPNGLKLPFNPQHDMTSCYQMMRGTVRVTDKNILLEIFIPLISVEEFQAFHLVPVPIHHANENIRILAESTYLLVTLKRNTFYQMNDNEFEKCIKTSGTLVICNTALPAQSIESPHGLCERDLLASKHDMKNCKFQTSPVSDFWVPLKTKNKWIYGLQQTTTINVIKKSEIDTTKLHGSGIITLQPGCELSYNGRTINGQSNVITNNTIDFQPMLNLSDIITTNQAAIHIENITVNHRDRLSDITKKIHQLKNTTKIHHSQHIVQHSTVAIIIIILISVLVWKCWKRIVTWIKRSNTDLSPQKGNLTTIDTSSDDSTMNEFNTDSRHCPGGCPFRT